MDAYRKLLLDLLRRLSCQSCKRRSQLPAASALQSACPTQLKVSPHLLPAAWRFCDAGALAAEANQRSVQCLVQHGVEPMCALDDTCLVTAARRLLKQQHIRQGPVQTETPRDRPCTALLIWTYVEVLLGAPVAHSQDYHVPSAAAAVPVDHACKDRHDTGAS